MLSGITRRRSRTKSTRTGATDVTLCTLNLKHYRSVMGLVTEQPYKR